MSKVNRIIGVPVAALALAFGFVSPALATPQNIPTLAEARTHLAALTVRAEGSSTGYSRDKFPHWSTYSGACNTREYVLKRDGTNVVQDSSCAATSARERSRIRSPALSWITSSRGVRHSGVEYSG